MIRPQVKKLFLAMVAALALGGCGGGGGGGGLSISMPQAPLKGSFSLRDLPARLDAAATVRGSLLATTVHVVIVDPMGVFVPGAVPYSEGEGDEYVAELRVSEGAPIGVSRGTLEVRICADAACQSLLTSATRPYEITIRPPTIAALPDVLATGAVRDGTAGLALRLEGANTRIPLYVSVSDPVGAFSAAAVRLTPAASSSAEYRARLPLLPGIAAKGYSGTAMLRLCGDASCASPFLARELPYRLQVYTLIQGIAHGLALDAARNLYVANGQTIRKIAPSGAESIIFRWTGSEYPGAHAVAVDAAGNVFFGHDSSAIYRIAPNGSISRFSNHSTRDLSVDAAGNLYTVSRALFKLGPDGTDVAWGEGYDRPNEPLGVSVAADGVVFVADLVGVIRVSKDGTASSVLPFQAYYRNRDVAAGSGGSVLVTDDEGVYRIRADGAVETIIAPGMTLAESDALFSPRSIARADDGTTGIADGYNNVILVTNIP